MSAPIPIENDPFVKEMRKIFLTVLVVALAVWVTNSSMEAMAYERVTGVEVATWDAMWLKLQVDCGTIPTP